MKQKIQDIKVARLLIVPIFLPFVLMYEILERIFFMAYDVLSELIDGARNYIRAWRDL